MSLDPRNREIRLAILAPRNSVSASASDPNTSGIHLDLKKVSLKDEPEYTAVSYVWGDASDTIPITVDGREFHATRNLIALLTELREEKDSVTLWTDAVCIRQTDNDEKASQIQLMGQIYKGATTTVLWLGEDADGSADAIKTLNNFAAARPADAAISEDPLEDKPTQMRLRQMMLSDPTVSTDRNHPDLASIQTSVKALLNREYWFRVWCLQEFCLSRNAVLACGHNRLDIGAFLNINNPYISLLSFDAVDNINNHMLDILHAEPQNDPSDLIKRPSFTPGALRMVLQRWRYHSGRSHGRGDLIDHLIEAYTCRASVSTFEHDTILRMEPLRSTDPRDRIYGLLSLASDVEELCIQPDYNKTCEQVYCEAWLAILKGRKNCADLVVMVLVSVGMNRNDKSTAEETLPTWVPDWRQTCRLSNLCNKVTEGRPFAACGEAHWESTWATTDNARILSLGGVEVDTVREAGVSFNNMPETMLINLAELLDEIRRFTQSSASMQPDDPVYTPEALQDAIWRIPICDLDWTYNDRRVIRANTTTAENFESVMAMYETAKASDNIDDAYMYGAMPSLDVKSPGFTNISCYLARVSESNGRRLLLTECGWVGFGPAGMEPGDKVVIFFGCAVPAVLRPCEDETYQLVGDAYVHGLMDGEFMETERLEKTFYLC